MNTRFRPFPPHAMALLASLIGWVASAEPPGGHYAAINGLNLYYEVHGDGAPVLLLHGGGSSIDTSFGKAIGELARTHQVIAFDQQGHGRTADRDAPFLFEQSADDAAALLRHLKVERADVIGFSNGGTIALQLAVRHPALVRKLVVISGAAKHDGMRPEFWQGMQHARLEDMPPELRETYLKISPHPQKLRSFLEKSVQRMLSFKDMRDDELRQIEAPALFMVGDSDVMTPEHAIALSKLVRHGSVAVLPMATHATMTEWQPAELAMVERYLAAPLPQERR